MGRKSFRVRRLAKLIFALALLIAAVLAFAVFYPVTPRGETFVEIPPGSSSFRIAGELEKNGVIRNRYVFELLRLVRHHKLKAGEYRFREPATAYRVYQRIARGDIYIRTLVIPEGFNIFDIAAAVEAAKLGTKEQFLQAARADAKMIQDLDPAAPTVEGYLFPDTYKFTRLDSVHSIIAAMVKRFRQEAGALGLSGSNVHETVTLASLIEKEVGAPEERPLVASVFVNRLAREMPLATDPTVIYAALLAGMYRGTIHESDLKFNSPYNTYRILGLPPGPICNPGIASLQAALHPAKSRYLYFVSDNNGHSRFSESLKEHNRNVAAYRKSVGGR